MPACPHPLIICPATLRHLLLRRQGKNLNPVSFACQHARNGQTIASVIPRTAKNLEWMIGGKTFTQPFETGTGSPLHQVDIGYRLIGDREGIRLPDEWNGKDFHDYGFMPQKGSDTSRPKSKSITKVKTRIEMPRPMMAQVRPVLTLLSELTV